MATASKRRWFQFSTRGLLVLMTLVAIGLGLWVSKAHRRNQAMSALRKVARFNPYGKMVRFARSPGWFQRQGWLSRWLGEDFFKEPVEIELSWSRAPNGDAAFSPLGELQSLKRLSLDSTSAGDKGMPYFRALANLEYLNVASSKAGDDALANLSGLAKLAELNLSRTRVTDAGMKHLAGLTRLKLLKLQETKVGDEAIRLLANLPQLETLLLSGTLLNGSGFADLRALPALTHLDLSRTALTDDALRNLPGATALQTLSLNDTAIGDDGLNRIDRFKALETLELCGTKITRKSLRHLQALPRLSYLNLCDTQIDDGDIDALNKMRSLVSVSLIGTRVSEAGLTRLGVTGSIASEPVDAHTRAAFRELTDFATQPLTDVIDYLKQRHDQEIQFDPRLFDDNDPRISRSPVTSTRNNISLLQALEELLAPEKLVLVYRHSVPLIMARPVKPALKVPYLADGEKLSPRLQFELTQPTELDFAGEPLPYVVESLQRLHMIDLAIDEDAFRRAKKPYDVLVTRTIKGIPLRSGLGLLLEPLDMRCEAEGDALVIRPVSAFAGAKGKLRSSE